MNIPRPEYPRPRLVRDKWVNLNGEWNFAFDFGDSGKYKELWKKDNYAYDRKIVVPFVPESKLSGIEYTDFFTTCWYQRSFTLPENWDAAAGHVLLHFGAVDFYCEAWVNEKQVGSHRGGYTPFTFDITSALASGENELVVRCYDNGRDPLQYTGKQIYFNYYNKSCYYTRCTGIWQTVWLEYVPQTYLSDLKLTPDVDNEKLDVVATFSASLPVGNELTAFVSFKNEGVTAVTAKVSGKICAFSIPMPNANLWSIEAPNLYDLTITCGEDTIRSYFGMRKVAINGYAVEINNKPVYQRLVLDQGYYEDGIITAPTVEDLEKDILMSQKVGFNGARLHMKVFEPYTLYYADKHGYLVWGEFPNWGMSDHDPGSLSSFLPGWMEAVNRDYNSPALVGWCPFNETGSSRRKDLFANVYKVTKQMDPIRPVIDTSGYVHGDFTDIFDVHDYDQNPESMRERYQPLVTGEGEIFMIDPRNEHYDGQPYFVSEFGGIFWDISEHGGDDWGYGKAPEDMEEFYTRFEGMIDVLLENPKMCAFCYTQLTDVYQEKNGIYAFDRRSKFDPERLHAILSKKAAIEK